jgi:RNA polymerase sigma-70 factor (ECF subfamily)
MRDDYGNVLSAHGAHGVAVMLATALEPAATGTLYAPGPLTDLATAFEEHRSHLRVVAYRMLGSAGEADDAVQEAWLKLTRADTGAIQNLRGWLTTVVARVCLDMLRARTARREEPLDAAPEPAVAATADQELAESVGLALMVVLDKLEPAERIAFVLHDLCAIGFDEIAAIVGRSTVAARQLASRARRRVHLASAPEIDLVTQRRVVEAFIAALRAGDVEALVAVLGGNREWATSAIEFQRKISARATEGMRPALIDGRVGLALAPGGKLTRVLIFTFAGATIRDAEIVTEPDALAELAIADLP